MPAPFRGKAVDLVWIQQTSAEWQATTDRILLTNELALETDTGHVKLGDGRSLWGSLNYWNPSGAGAAPNGGIFDVTRFGAIGNGSADDTNAFGEASAAAVAFGRGGTVYVPRPSSCYLVSSWNVDNSVGLQVIGTHSPSGLGLTTQGAVVLTSSGKANQTNSFIDANVTPAADTITITNHGYVTGTQLILSTANPLTNTLPTGLPGAYSPVFAIVINASTIKLAGSLANANAGIAYDITAATGGGTYYLNLFTNSLLSARSAQGLTLRNLRILYSSTAFMGDLVDFTSNGSDAAFINIESCEMRGLPADTSSPNTKARCCVNLTQAIIANLRSNQFSYADYGIIGKTVNSYSNVVNITDNNLFLNIGKFGIKNGGEQWNIRGNAFEGNINPANSPAPTSARAGAYDDIEIPSFAQIVIADNWMGDVYYPGQPWVRFRGQSLILTGNDMNTAGGGQPCVVIETSGTTVANVVAANNFFFHQQAGTVVAFQFQGSGGLTRVSLENNTLLGGFGTMLGAGSRNVYIPVFNSHNNTNLADESTGTVIIGRNLVGGNIGSVADLQNLMQSVMGVASNFAGTANDNPYSDTIFHPINVGGTYGGFRFYVGASNQEYLSINNGRNCFYYPLNIGTEAAGGSDITRAKHGTATLVAGVVTIADATITASTRIFVQRQTDAGTIGASYSVTRTAGASFTITSKQSAGTTQTADTSVVAYWTVEP